MKNFKEFLQRYRDEIIFALLVSYVIILAFGVISEIFK